MALFKTALIAHQSNSIKSKKLSTQRAFFIASYIQLKKKAHKEYELSSLRKVMLFLGEYAEEHNHNMRIC